jgi:hypothetical protein
MGMVGEGEMDGGGTTNRIDVGMDIVLTELG